MLIDGNAVANEIYAELKKERARMPHPPRLGIIVGVQDGATAAYVRLKERRAAELGVEVKKEILTPSTTSDGAAALVQDLSRTQNGVVVQLPLPQGLAAATVLSAIAPRVDVDALNPTVNEIERAVHAPIAEAIDEIFNRTNVNLRDAKAVVVGAGPLVGAPAAALLRRCGASVTTVTLEQGSLEQLKDADIVVLGAGSPGLVKPEMLKQGVVLIDAGTSESNGKMVGDADPRCAEVSSLFTPVPGGVGPITIAMLFKNLFALTRASAQ